MAMSLDTAAEVFRQAMRETVKRYSMWYLIQGIVLVAANPGDHLSVFHRWQLSFSWAGC